MISFMLSKAQAHECGSGWEWSSTGKWRASPFSQAPFSPWLIGRDCTTAHLTPILRSLPSSFLYSWTGAQNHWSPSPSDRISRPIDRERSGHLLPVQNHGLGLKRASHPSCLTLSYKPPRVVLVEEGSRRPCSHFRWSNSGKNGKTADIQWYHTGLGVNFIFSDLIHESFCVQQTGPSQQWCLFFCWDQSSHDTTLGESRDIQIAAWWLIAFLALRGEDFLPACLSVTCLFACHQYW